MRVAKLLRGCAVVLATAAMFVSSLPGLHAAETSPAVKSTTVDVALGANGRLRGQVVNAQGVAAADSEVLFQSDRGDVARMMTDKDGYFTAQGLRPGLYAVTTKGSQGLLRVWSPEAAPPAAIQNVLLVSDPTAVRGALGPLGIGALLIIASGIAIGVAVATSSS